MNRSISRLKTIVAVACLALAATFAATALAAGVHFERESITSYEAQLHKGEVRAASFHPGSAGASGHLHISLNDGRHLTVSYAPSEQAKLIAQAQAKGARVVVASVKAKAKPVKHKLRYYAGGALIVVILIVLAVLLIGRRRTIMEQAQQTTSAEDPPEPGPTASSDAE